MAEKPGSKKEGKKGKHSPFLNLSKYSRKAGNNLRNTVRSMREEAAAKIRKTFGIDKKYANEKKEKPAGERPNMRPNLGQAAMSAGKGLAGSFLAEDNTEQMAEDGTLTPAAAAKKGAKDNAGILLKKTFILKQVAIFMALTVLNAAAMLAVLLYLFVSAVKTFAKTLSSVGHAVLAIPGRHKDSEMVFKDKAPEATAIPSQFQITGVEPATKPKSPLLPPM